MDFKYENNKLNEGYSFVIGCDEVGRGCLAGPVVAAAVVLDELKIKNLSADKAGSKLKIGDVKDSKQLSAKKREELSEFIKDVAMWSIAEVPPGVVDEINIHNASLLAMKKATDSLVRRCERSEATLIVVDGKFKIPDFDYHQEAVVGGDNKVLSIAAASIIAKVYRDNLMQKFDKQFPVYEFARHKGYATEVHRQMIQEHGLCNIHRLTFCHSLA